MVEDPKNHSGATSLINCSCSASHIQSLGEVRCFTSSRVLHQFNCRVSIHVLPMNDFWKTCSEAATRGVLCKKVFLEISQNSQENTCTIVSFLIKLQASIFYRTPLDDCFYLLSHYTQIWKVYTEFIFYKMTMATNWFSALCVDSCSESEHVFFHWVILPQFLPLRACIFPLGDFTTILFKTTIPGK